MTYEVTHLLVAELSWNVDLDAGAWLRTYMAERYGTVADAMEEYFENVEGAGRMLFDRSAGNYGDLDVVTRVRDGFLAAREAASRAHDQAAPGTSAAFLTGRLAANADFAVADTEISYHGLRGEPDQVAEAKQRVHDLVTAHRFDGIIKTSMWTLRRYQSGVLTGRNGREATRWVYDMYRAHDADDSAPPAGSSYVSDLEPVWAGNGLGPVERDQSNGGAGAGDGGQLTIDGETYAKGLGAHAYSDTAFHLGGMCSLFTASVGVDDEVGGPSEPPIDGDPVPAAFEDGWDFRGHDGEQMVIGEPTGTSAVLGTTEGAEASDPAWAPSPVADASGNQPVVPSLDGADDVIALPGVDGVDLSDGFVVEGWFYPRSLAEFPRFLERGDLSLFVNSNGALVAYARPTNGSRVDTVSTAGVVAENAWTHVAVFYDPGEGVFRLFVNGAEVTYSTQEPAMSGARFDAAGPMLIGNRGASERGFEGLVAFARVVTPARARDEWTLGLFPLQGRGSVVFEVWADDSRLYQSDVLTGGMPARDVSVSVAGAERLRLVVTDAYNGNSDDHADWADAHVTCAQSAERTSSAAHGPAAATRPTARAD